MFNFGPSPDIMSRYLPPGMGSTPMSPGLPPGVGAPIPSAQPINAGAMQPRMPNVGMTNGLGGMMMPPPNMTPGMPPPQQGGMQQGMRKPIGNAPNMGMMQRFRNMNQGQMKQPQQY